MRDRAPHIPASPATLAGGHLRLPAALALALGLAACADTAHSPPQTAQPAAAPASASPAPRPGATARSAADFDTASAEERAAARAPATGGQELGRNTVSLGNPAETGFWLRTPLVSTETPGRVVAANGQAVNVTLIPASDTGGRLSLSAYQALGLPLTALPTVQVFTR
ncbi:hypothetical protein ACFQXB_03755 [Plastorhodobacter daqingensis]|uniref:D-galactarate dehydratase n=1 Tax=Plastorhodobacter daqingensis TaxID=1387281 RepID=A0ABW2UF52_9RHOB